MVVELLRQHGSAYSLFEGHGRRRDLPPPTFNSPFQQRQVRNRYALIKPSFLVTVTDMYKAQVKDRASPFSHQEQDKHTLPC